MENNEKANSRNDLPNVSALEEELRRVNRRSQFRKLLKSTVYTLIVTAALAVLVAVFLMPVMRIYGSSMSPTLKEGQIVVSVKHAKIKSGDIVGVYYGSKLLIKRCIATGGQSVMIDEDGNVFVDGVLLDEPYVIQKSLGETDIEMPFIVPEHTIFVIGDNRETSIDSRNTALGCIDLDDVAGKLIFRAWPLGDFGKI